jgi:hypothetical protein
MALPSQIVDQVIHKLPADVQQWARSISSGTSRTSFFSMIDSSFVMFRHAACEKDVLPGYSQVNEARVVREFAVAWVQVQSGFSDWDEYHKESAIRMQIRKWGFRVGPAEMDAVLERLHKCTTISGHKAGIQQALSHPQDDATLGNAVDLQQIYDESRQWIRQVLAEHNGPLTRQGCEALPGIPAYRENNARAGLDDNLQWCDDAIRVVGELPARVGKNVITELIGLFQQLRQMPGSHFPKIDKDLFEKARRRTERIFGKCTARGQRLQRIPFEHYWDNPRLQWVASVVAEIAMTAKDGPLQPLSTDRSVHQIPMDELSRRAGEARRHARFYAAAEKIYRLIDPQYANGLRSIEEEIDRVAREINKIDSTDAGRIVDTFEKLTSGGFQDLYNAIGRAHHIDQIVASAMFGVGADQLFYRESRESLIDKAIGRLEHIQAEGESTRMEPGVEQSRAEPLRQAPDAGSKENAGGHASVIFENSNVTMGDIQQAQNVVTGDCGSIRKDVAGHGSRNRIKRTITASILFLAGLLTVLQILFGWMDWIWRFLMRTN